MRDKEVVSCKYCGEIEYYMDMRWFNGRQMCRNCYKDEYEEMTGKLYEWDDLDGNRPKWEDSMDLYKFITHEEIEMVAENIKNKVDFEIERNYKGYQFRLHSSRAGVDFKNGTKEGDYIVGIDFSTNTRGWRRPVSGEKLKELGDTESLKKYIDKKLGESRIESYETLDRGQISLFEMMI